MIDLEEVPNAFTEDFVNINEKLKFQKLWKLPHPNFSVSMIDPVDHEEDPNVSDEDFVNIHMTRIECAVRLCSCSQVWPSFNPHVFEPEINDVDGRSVFRERWKIRVWVLWWGLSNLWSS